MSPAGGDASAFAYSKKSIAIREDFQQKVKNKK